MSNAKPVSNPKGELPLNPLFERPTPESRELALTEINEILTRQIPVNSHSPIVVIAPTPVHQSWQYAARKALPGRYVEVKNVHEFKDMVPNMSIQWIIVLDDVYPDQRPYLSKAIKGLNPDLGHRLFPVTTQYKDPDAAAKAGFAILGLGTPKLTNPFSIPGPNEDTNK